LFDSADSGATWAVQSLYDMNFKVTATVPEVSSALALMFPTVVALFAVKIYRWQFGLPYKGTGTTHSIQTKSYEYKQL